MCYKEDTEELMALYVRLGDCGRPDEYYAKDDVFGWYDGVTHVSKDTWDEYQRLRKEVVAIEDRMMAGMRHYTAEEGVRP